MALYEYRCRTCDGVFEVRRPMHDANTPIDCPAGHADTVRLFSVFARTRMAAGAPAVATGGCCGGSCGCAH